MHRQIIHNQNATQYRGEKLVKFKHPPRLLPKFLPPVNSAKYVKCDKKTFGSVYKYHLYKKFKKY